MKSETWFVYILRCLDGSLYKGIAKDLNRQSWAAQRRDGFPCARPARLTPEGGE